MSVSPNDENQHLGISSITPFIAGCNTELKCVVLEPLAAAVGAPMGERQIYDATILDITSPMLARKITPNNLGNSLSKLPAGLVDISTGPSTDKREYTLTKAGLLSAAVGGQLLRLSEISSKSIRLFVGEYAGDVSEQDTMNSLEARLIVLSGLYTYARNKWHSTSNLNSGFERYGLQPAPAAHHLKRLNQCGLVETKIVQSSRGWKERLHRIQSKDQSTYYDPAEVISGYLEIVGKFACMDINFLNEGLAHLTRICHDKAKLPYMVKRSFSAAEYQKQVGIPKATMAGESQMTLDQAKLHLVT